MTTDRTLADSLRDLYHYFLSSLTDDDMARKWERDWPANERGIAEVLRKIDLGPITFVDDSGPVDPAPFVEVRLDHATGRVSFATTTADDAFGLPLAEDFDPDGDPLDGEPIA